MVCACLGVLLLSYLWLICFPAGLGNLSPSPSTSQISSHLMALLLVRAHTGTHSPRSPALVCLCCWIQPCIQVSIKCQYRTAVQCTERLCVGLCSGSGHRLNRAGHVYMETGCSLWSRKPVSLCCVRVDDWGCGLKNWLCSAGLQMTHNHATKPATACASPTSPGARPQTEELSHSACVCVYVCVCAS